LGHRVSDDRIRLYQSAFNPFLQQSTTPKIKFFLVSRCRIKPGTRPAGKTNCKTELNAKALKIKPYPFSRLPSAILSLAPAAATKNAQPI
jgi:hypothetical protein